MSKLIPRLALTTAVVMVLAMMKADWMLKCVGGRTGVITGNPCFRGEMMIDYGAVFVTWLFAAAVVSYLTLKPPKWISTVRSKLPFLAKSTQPESPQLKQSELFYDIGGQRALALDGEMRALVTKHFPEATHAFVDVEVCLRSDPKGERRNAFSSCWQINRVY